MTAYLLAYELQGDDVGERSKCLRHRLAGLHSQIVLSSVWLIVSDLTASEIENTLSKFLQNDDILFIAEIGRDRAFLQNPHQPKIQEWFQRNARFCVGDRVKYVGASFVPITDDPKYRGVVGTVFDTANEVESGEQLIWVEYDDGYQLAGFEASGFVLA